MPSERIGAMTRREIAWRLEMADKKLRRRALRFAAPESESTVDTNPEFSEEEGKRLNAALEGAKARVAERFQGRAPG